MQETTPAPQKFAQAEELIGLTVVQMKAISEDMNQVRENIGEKIYYKVLDYGFNEDQTSKITGILID
jgi:hypothetical protein